jgi:hypothetical protein
MSNAGSMNGATASAKPPIKVVMAYYDALPKLVREKVANAALDWDTTAIYANLRSRRAAPSEVIALIENYERKYCRGPL